MTIVRCEHWPPALVRKWPRMEPSGFIFGTCNTHATTKHTGKVRRCAVGGAQAKMRYGTRARPHHVEAEGAAKLRRQPVERADGAGGAESEEPREQPLREVLCLPHQRAGSIRRH